MSEGMVGALDNSIKALISILQKFFDQLLDLLMVLNRLPEFFENLYRTIVEGFNRQIQARGEMEIHIKMANLGSKQCLISSEREAIQEVKRQYEEDFKKIDDRYTQIQNDLNDQAKKRVRELDEHLLSLYEKYYPDDIEAGHRNRFDSFMDLAYSHSRNSYLERMTKIIHRVRTVKEHLLSFQRDRKQFFNNIDSFVSGETLNRDSDHVLPVWLVELEDQTDQSRSLHAFLPGAYQIDFQTHDEAPETRVECDGRLQEMHDVLQTEHSREMLSNAFVWEKNDGIRQKLMENTENVFSQMPVRLKNVSWVKKAYCQAVEQSDFQTIKEMRSEKNQDTE